MEEWPRFSFSAQLPVTPATSRPIFVYRTTSRPDLRFRCERCISAGPAIKSKWQCSDSRRKNEKWFYRFGCNNAARDIVGEWAIYMRERMVSLKLPSYVFAKLGILAAICLLQCTVLLAIVYPVCKLQSGFGATLLILFVASQVGAALGLLISSFAATTEAAIAVLPIPLLFMILLSGGIKPLDKTPERLMSYAFPSRWAFEANIVREANARGTPTLKPQSAPFAAGVPDIADTPFPAKEGRHSYREIIAILTGMIAVLVAAVIGILRRRDIQ